MKKIFAGSLMAISALAFADASHAGLAFINGSASLGGTSFTISGTDLSNPGNVTFSPLAVNSLIPPTGDLAPISPTVTSVTPNPYTLQINAGTATLGSFAISGPSGFGTFTPSAYQIVTQTATFLNVIVSGIYHAGTLTGTQAGGCNTGGNTCEDTGASINWALIKVGSTTSGNAVLSVVPEPATLLLLGAGLAGMATRVRRSAPVSA